MSERLKIGYRRRAGISLAASEWSRWDLEKQKCRKDGEESDIET